MTSYVLDTNIVSLILRSEIQVMRRFRSALAADGVILSCPIVWYEIYRGLLSKDAKRQIQRFEALFSSFVWDNYRREDWTLVLIFGRYVAAKDYLLTMMIYSSPFSPGIAVQCLLPTTKKILWISA
jgi:predicted nucleic acid-binding protein